MTDTIASAITRNERDSGSSQGIKLLISPFAVRHAHGRPGYRPAAARDSRHSGLPNAGGMGQWPPRAAVVASETARGVAAAGNTAAWQTGGVVGEVAILAFPATMAAIAVRNRLGRDG
jgi:hypothetical protein